MFAFDVKNGKFAQHHSNMSVSSPEEKKLKDFEGSGDAVFHALETEDTFGEMLDCFLRRQEKLDNIEQSLNCLTIIANFEE